MGDFQCIGVLLSSWGGRFLVDKQANLTSPVIPLNEEWQNLAITLQRLFHREDKAITMLEQFVNHLHDEYRPDVTPVRAAVELLHTNNGQYGIDELARDCYLSRSQLERRFNYLTGVSPKTMSRLIRFQAICRSLSAESHQMTELAHQFGYTDQSHFIHEVEALSGYTPRNIVAYRRQRAVDASFLQFFTC